MMLPSFSPAFVKPSMSAAHPSDRGRRVGLLAMAVMLAACGGSGTPTSTTTTTPPSQPSTTATVAAQPSLSFSPRTVTIVRGGTVTFSFGTVAHNVFFDNQPAGAPANIPGDNANTSKSLTFQTTGTFIYNCHIHPGMQGTVIVVAPGA
jgi:plastocyanin